MQVPERSALTGFSDSGLDRLASARDDEAAFERLFADSASSAVVLCRDLAIVRRTSAGLRAFFPKNLWEGLGPAEETVLLGRSGAGATFGLALPADALEDPPPGDVLDHLPLKGRPDCVAMNVRSLALGGLVTREEIGLLGQAKSLLGWHARHRFCSVCGAGSRIASAGWRRACASCGAAHFPRTDPVVIMLVVAGERCLLGRQPRFPKGMYSALAGFLEPGETIENAVRREILEESGVKVGAVAYHASQPWPFPSSLMIGCIAQATSEAVTIDKTELEDCRWFDRSELAAMFAGDHPSGFTAPQPIAIAHLLMRDWLEGRTLAP